MKIQQQAPVKMNTVNGGNVPTVGTTITFLGLESLDQLS